MTVLANVKSTQEEFKSDASDPGIIVSSRENLADSMKAGRWKAELSLKIENRSAGARLVSCDRKGPLHVQKAFYPEGNDLAHLYILHPPGGLVSGDSLIVKTSVAEDSHALVTTPGAGRLYGAREDAGTQIQNNKLEVSSGASLEWFPMETLFYSRSYGVSKTRVDIEKEGKFLGWDICSLGLPASKQPFLHGQLRQCFEIYYDGKIDWLERWRFSADDDAFLSSKAGLQNQSCNGFFVAGPFIGDSSSRQNQAVTTEVINQLHALCQAVQGERKGIAGISKVSHWLVIRYLGHSTTHARDLFTNAWTLLRPLLLNRPACAPRIWAC